MWSCGSFETDDVATNAERKKLGEFGTCDRLQFSRAVCFCCGLPENGQVRSLRSTRQQPDPQNSLPSEWCGVRGHLLSLSKLTSFPFLSPSVKIEMFKENLAAAISISSNVTSKGQAHSPLLDSSLPSSPVSTHHPRSQSRGGFQGGLWNCNWY